MRKKIKVLENKPVIVLYMLKNLFFGINAVFGSRLSAVYNVAAVYCFKHGSAAQKCGFTGA